MKRIFFVLFMPAVSFFLITCNSLNNSDTATVTIDTGIGTTKAAAPSDVTSISVTISGSGMSDITASVPTDTGVLTLEVPIGTARLFSVTAVAGNFTYLGSTTQDIAAGGTVNISISMVKQVGTLNVTIPNQSDYAVTVQSFIVTVAISETSGFEQVIFTPSETITMDVPPGNNRGISLITTPLSQSAVVSFSTETATSDFTHGQATAITLSPVVIETKIVIPDTRNSRIVQIDNMDGDGWLTATLTMPYDIDFDNLGRIYIATNEMVTSGAKIIRMDDINSSQTTLPVTLDGGYVAVTIDRNNDLMYYASNNQIYRANIDGTGIKDDFDMTGFTTVRGIDLTSSGILLVAHDNYFSSYDPNTGNGTLINSLQYTGGSTPYSYDMIEKGQSIYGALNEDATSSQFFIRDFYLNSSNELVEIGGIYTDLYGARKFINNFTSRIYFINEYSSSNTLSVIDDIVGTGREDYGTNGTGQDQFQFYQ